MTSQKNKNKQKNHPDDYERLLKLTEGIKRDKDGMAFGVLE
jgi:hypothetical protein